MSTTQPSTISLSKAEKREMQGIMARQKEIDALTAPLQADVNDFLSELQERYGVKLGVTHNISFDKFELIPIKAAEVPAAQIPEPAAELSETNDESTTVQ